MANTDNSAHAQLISRIEQLKSNKASEEQRIKSTVKELTSNFSPSSIIKTAIHDLAADSRVHYDLTRMTLYTGTNYVLDKLIGKNKPIRDIVNAVIAEKLSDSSSGNNGSFLIPIVADFIVNLIHPRSNNDEK